MGDLMVGAGRWAAIAGCARRSAFNGASVANGLTGQRALFVSAYIGEARGNASEAARIAGYKKPGQEGHRLLKNAEIQEEIQAWRDEVKSRGIASLEYRVNQLDILEQKYFALIEARAIAYKDVPGAIGGETGVVVGQLKKVTHVRPGEGDEPTETWTEEQWEYVADVAVTREIRAIYDDAAKELGQRVDKVNVSGNLTREYVIVRPGEQPPNEDHG